VRVDVALAPPCDPVGGPQPLAALQPVHVRRRPPASRAGQPQPHLAAAGGRLVDDGDAEGALVGEEGADVRLVVLGGAADEGPDLIF